MLVDPALLPPLSLYVHLPWCVRKCPYCDFNSYERHAYFDPAAYVEAVLADLTLEQAAVHGRAIGSVFFGGGTPSLFEAADIERLLRGIESRLSLTGDCEITLEANPGASDAARFDGYRAAGVNRLSIGAQSFAPEKLKSLGRIHGPEEIWSAVSAARAARFENLNLDLMFGLPGQTSSQALDDLEQALACAPTHLSWYQLTLESRTPLHRRSPQLPSEDAIEEIQCRGLDRLTENGLVQYEVSAFSLSGWQCRHNRNYWMFGDYLGVGAGAHSKVTNLKGNVQRRWRVRRPRDYVEAAGTEQAIGGARMLNGPELAWEFALNALRLVDGVDESLFRSRSFQPEMVIAKPISRARALGLLVADRLQATPFGWRYLDNLVGLFQPD